MTAKTQEILFLLDVCRFLTVRIYCWSIKINKTRIDHILMAPNFGFIFFSVDPGLWVSAWIINWMTFPESKTMANRIFSLF